MRDGGERVSDEAVKGSEDEAAVGAPASGAAPASDGAPVTPAPPAPRPERRDAEGLPLDREPTLDDVRGESGSGRTIAWGCTALVVVTLAGFWLVRVFLLG